LLARIGFQQGWITVWSSWRATLRSPRNYTSQQLPLADEYIFRHTDFRNVFSYLPAVCTADCVLRTTELFAMKVRSTTILTVRHKNKVAIGGDGQVTLGTAVMKADAVKIRRLAEGKVVCGFAGSSADAFALLERFESKLKDFPSNVPRAATELAKEWRTDRILRRLEALLAVVDAKHTLLITGTGDVIQPTDGVLGIGSGGSYAVAAARALVAHSPLGAGEIVRKSLEIAAGIDIYTNTNIVVEEFASE
jgi:ATP-dependent HslUV protease, peptidase subunit HslV